MLNNFPIQGEPWSVSVTRVAISLATGCQIDDDGDGIAPRKPKKASEGVISSRFA